VGAGPHPGAVILVAIMKPGRTADDADSTDRHRPPHPDGGSAVDRPRPRRARGRDPQELLASARSGDRGATGRLLSLLERGGEPARAVGRLTFAAGTQAEQVVGITGAPGAGKSTLTDQLIRKARASGRRVGVLAVDPSSPFSGGAILGDRIRMQNHALEEDVFIRSMATRGHHGGLALAAPEAIRVLVAAGLPFVLVETVGVGQVEVEVAGEADTTVVVVNPGWGDAIQASKAGLLEVADVFVVNKADRPGAAETARDLEGMLDMNMSMGDWRPPVVLATGSTGEGVDELWSAVGAHREYLESSGEIDTRRERRLVGELQKALTWRLEEDVKAMRGGSLFEQVAAQVVALRIDPYQGADRLARLARDEGPAAAP
jgi:LAO/AO transport system kinase